MIFGSVNLKCKHKPQNHVLENILNQISWNEGLSQLFESGFFKGVFITDKRLPSLEKEDVYFSDKKNDIVVFIDGYIYNKKEIKLKLNLQKDFSTPELIAKAYKKWGNLFAEKLNGDFVICLYFETTNTITFFNDHLGIRPIAITIMNSTVYFGTDVMGLCKALFKDKKIDKEYLLNLFLLGGYNFSMLPQQDIIKLNPGHYIKISSDKQEYQPYWFPEKIVTDYSLNLSTVIKDLSQLLNDAVEIRADKHFTASAHLSGGLDSGIVAVLVRKAFADQKTFYGFSWTPDIALPCKIKKDERLTIKKICHLNKMTPVFTNYDGSDYLAYLSNWHYPSEFLYENQIINSASEHGINLIFSGWGGDEFISIGDYGIDADLIRDLDWNYFLKRYPFRHLRNFFYALFFKGLFPSLKPKRSHFKTNNAVYKYIKNTLKNNRIPRKKRYNNQSRREFHLQLVKKRHLSARTADWYVLGQHNGIEYRYPLMDKRIVEYMLKVPSRCLINGKIDRLILRLIGKGILPDEVLYASKSDPVSNYHFDLVMKSIEKQLVNEFEDFRNNPDLNFINFDLLEKKITELNSVDHSKHTKDDLIIFHYLKRAHEFIKGYYNA